MKRSSIVPQSPPRPRSRPRLGRSDARACDEIARLARTFRALGDPTRSRMVLELSGGERCVSDLARAVGLSLSATSHRLRGLRDLDLVRVRRVGKRQLYALNDPAFGFCAPGRCQAWRLVRAAGPA